MLSALGWCFSDSEIEAEKDKLYASIGYSEGAVKGKFPDEVCL